MFDGKCSRRSICPVFLIVATSFAVFFPLQTVLAEKYFNKSFEWYYQGTRWTWNLSIPQSLYDLYKSVSVSDRNRYGLAGYGFLVTTQDYYVTQLANKLHEAAIEKGYGTYDEVSFILAFVQSLPFTSDSVTTGYDEYPRFPLETLVDDGGDCEDTSILFAALVLILDYDAIFISPPRHVAVGVWGKKLSGSYYTYNNKTYYYSETTGDNWKIGDIPSEYRSVSARLYSIDQRRQYKPGYTPDQDISRTPGQENESKSFLQRSSEWLAMILIVAVLSIVIISAVYVILKLLRVQKVEEIVNTPNGDRYF